MDNNERGRAALRAVHNTDFYCDEKKLNFAISSIYKVGLEEAAEIHANYHMERIANALTQRAREHGMSIQRISELLPKLDIANLAFQVAYGSLVEPAAVDLLFKTLYYIESQGKHDDRYVQFYG